MKLALVLGALALGASCVFVAPTTLACNDDVNCPASFVCDAATHACHAAPAEGEGAAGEGEGDASEGEGDASEGEGDAGEGEGASSEGEGASSEGEGASGEGEGASGEGEGASGEGEGASGEGEGEGGEGEGEGACVIDYDERWYGPALSTAWTASGTGGSADGDLEISAASTVDLAAAPADLSDAFALVEIKQAPAAGSLVFAVSDGSGASFAHFVVSSAGLHVATDDAQVSDDFALARFLRISMHAGALTWATSANGSSFNTRDTIAAPAFAGSAVVHLGGTAATGAFGDLRVGHGSCATTCQPLIDDPLAANDAEITSSGGGTAVAHYVNGNLHIDIAAGSDTAFASGRTSVRDFTNTETTLVFPVAASTGAVSTFIQIQSDSQNLIDFGIQGGVLHFHVIEANVERGFSSQVDNRVANPVLRIVVDDTGVTLLGSPDGRAFMQLASAGAAPAFAAAAQLNFGAGAFGNHGADAAEFDALTILPAGCP